MPMLGNCNSMRVQFSQWANNKHFIIKSTVQITNSSAIKSIDFGPEGQVFITYTSSDKNYEYQATDLNAFQNDLNDVIEEGESVGQFVNRAIRAELIKQV